MTTILDIARMANVSKSAVSRVLNNQAGVSPKKREKILQVIEETNFVPNRAARTLKNADSNSILILFHRPSSATQRNPFFLEIISEISQSFENIGYDTIIQTFRTSENEISTTKRNILNQMVKGVILLSSPLDETFLFEIDQLNIPIVIIGKINHKFKNIYSVDTDNFCDSYRLVEVLIQNGHQKIACVHPPTDVHVSFDRVAGYQQCLLDHQIDIDPSLMIETSYSIEQKSTVIKELLSNTEKFSAIFCTDVLHTLEIYKAAKELNLSIPYDFSVISFNSETFSPFFSPEPSGIEIPIKQLSDLSVHLLANLITETSVVEKQLIAPTDIHLTNSILKL